MVCLQIYYAGAYVPLQGTMELDFTDYEPADLNHESMTEQDELNAIEVACC